MVEKLLLAAPRGYCAGVDRAVQTVERALDLYGAPVYVRKEIVHNKHVVDELRKRGAVFVDELDETIPEGAITVFSAHGVSPAVHAEAERRGLQTIDATCPLVTKVHREAVKFAGEGYTIVLIGHAGHEEVEGTMGEAPEHIVLVETEDDVDALEVEDPTASPTSRRPRCRSTRPARSSPGCASGSRTITGPRTDDICYATTNRQAAVKQMAPQCDLVLVIGSQNSSNSQRLVEVAREHGAESHLIDNAGQVERGVARRQARRRHLVRRERARGARRARSSRCSASAASSDVAEFEVVQEDVRFMLPKEIRQALAARPGEAPRRHGGARGARRRSPLPAAPAARPIPAAGASDVRNVPLEYFQGLTHDRGGHRYFAGLFDGVYARTRPRGARPAVPALPAAVERAGLQPHRRPDLGRAEGGRLILPLECYTPGAPNGGNTCGRGAFGVADPATLDWRYRVRLDPADIPKAMWAEVSPAGSCLDVQRRRPARLPLRDVNAATRRGGADPARAAPRRRRAAERRHRGGVRGRLLLAGEDAEPLQVWSVDGAGRLAAARWRSSAGSTASPRASTSSPAAAGCCTG